MLRLLIVDDEEELVSALAERLAPEEMVGLANQYTTVCTEAIQAEGGVVNKLTGDGVAKLTRREKPRQGYAKLTCPQQGQVQHRPGRLVVQQQAEALTLQLLSNPLDRRHQFAVAQKLVSLAQCRCPRSSTGMGAQRFE